MVSKNNPAERRRTFARLLRGQGIDSALVSNPKHIFYLTGVQSNLNPWLAVMKGPRSTSFLLLESSGEAHLLFGASEISNPWKGESVSEDAKKSFDFSVATYTDYSLDSRMITYGDTLNLELRRWLSGLKARGIRLRRLAIEEWHIGAVYAEAAEKATGSRPLPGLSQMLLAMRKTKGTDEVRNLTIATEMITFAYKHAKEFSRPGKTEEDLLREVNYQSFKKYGAFGEVIGDYVSGERTLNVGGWPTSRRFKKGDTIVLDLQAAHNNYWSDLCRTFVAGRPSSRQEHALEVLLKAKARAEAVMRPGAKGSEVYQAVNEELLGAGFPRLTHHAGHTVGLDDQEPPWFIPGENRTLEEGCVAVVEPGVYLPATGGMRVEDAYLITRTGCRKLSKFPYGLT